MVRSVPSVLSNGVVVTTTDAASVDVERLYRANWHSLVRLAALLVDEVTAAEDVVQEAFIGLHRRSSALRTPDAALGYLRTSIVNGSRSALRHRQVARRHLSVVARDEVGRTVDAADHNLLIAAEHAELMAALRQLPRRQREVLTLRYWGQLSERDVAETLGVSVGTVKSTASRALDKLESLMGERR